MEASPRWSTVLLATLVAFFVLPHIASAQTSWHQALLEERQEKDQWLREAKVSPLTAIGQRVMTSGMAVRATLPSDTLLLGHPSADVGIPALELTWRQQDGAVYARIPMGGDFRLHGRAIGPVPTELRHGDVIHAERFRLTVYWNERGARVMAFDPQHPKRRAFNGLDWFAPDSAWRVTARVKRAAQQDTVVMATSLGLEKQYLRHSQLHFTAPDGSEQALTLFVPAMAPESYGFLPFTDATSGEQTYGGGRYLDFEELPEVGGTLVVDFNRAYNPYCAYTSHYNCPVPPPENTLEVHVKAGERRYDTARNR